MKTELFDNFDIVMKRIQPIEPRASFDADFAQRFEQAVAERYRETIFEGIARKTQAAIRFALLPKVPRLATALATAVAIITAGFYFYSTLPTYPTVMSREGDILVKRAGIAEWTDAGRLKKIRTGDAIDVSPNASMDIAIRGKYHIRLKGSTRLSVAQLAPRRGRGTARFALAEGTMLVSVEEGFKGSRFVVETDSATSTALGTKFAVQVREREKSKTEISVLEGNVAVKSRYKPEAALLARQTVIVGAGQKTTVAVGAVPLTPQRLIERDRYELEELYHIGAKPQVMLLIKNTPQRVEELLRPCPIYISDRKPRTIPKLLEDAVASIKDALETKDKAKHLAAIKTLERIVKDYPDPRYDVQFLLYIGAYYNYLGHYEEAIATFEEVCSMYPESSLASLAQCAIGVIYDEKLHDAAKAEKAFKEVLEKYPNSLEAIWVESTLGMKKLV